MYIEICINEVKNKALVDSESAVNCISVDFYRYMKQSDEKLIIKEDKSLKATGANGNVVGSKGPITLPVTVGDEKWYIQFWVMEIREPVLIGRPFLKENVP